MQTKKKIKQTDAIFAKLKVVNTAADKDETVLRLSWDAKATVKIGDFARGGKNRLERKGSDHDFKAEGILNPFGILLPRWDDLTLYFTKSSVTSDFIVDMLERWWGKKQKQFPKVNTLVIRKMMPKPANRRIVDRSVVALDSSWPDCQDSWKPESSRCR